MAAAADGGVAKGVAMLFTQQLCEVVATEPRFGGRKVRGTPHKLSGELPAHSDDCHRSVTWSRPGSTMIPAVTR